MTSDSLSPSGLPGISSCGINDTWSKVTTARSSTLLMPSLSASRSSRSLIPSPSLSHWTVVIAVLLLSLPSSTTTSIVRSLLLGVDEVLLKLIAVIAVWYCSGVAVPVSTTVVSEELASSTVIPWGRELSSIFSTSSAWALVRVIVAEVMLSKSSPTATSGSAITTPPFPEVKVVL